MGLVLKKKKIKKKVKKKTKLSGFSMKKGEGSYSKTKRSERYSKKTKGPQPQRGLSF